MFKTGTATDPYDLATQLDAFLTATGSAFGLTYTGTGTGTFTAYKGGASSVAETFTITATSATNFTVVGSTSGSIGPATVGTPFAHAKIAFLISAGGTAFIAGDVFQITTAPKWTQLRGPNAASSTQWRVNIAGTSISNVELGEVAMMTTAGGATVTTGGTASASSGSTAANAFDGNGATECTLTGQSGWVQYTFASAQTIVEVALTMSSASIAGTGAMPKDFKIEYWNGSAWIPAGSWRNESSWAVGERRTFRLAPYIWQAPGNDGVSQIITGIAPIQNVGASWAGWRMQGFTSYNGTSDFFDQPGAIQGPLNYGPITPLAPGAMSYWFVVNGRRVMGVVKSGSVYSPFYMGLIAPYPSPGQWAYPLFVGGTLYFDTDPSSTSNLWAVGTAHAKHTSYMMPFFTNPVGPTTCSSGQLRMPDGSWLKLMSRSDFYDPSTASGGKTWPYAFGFTNLKPDLDGGYTLFPIMIVSFTPDNWYGQFDGVHAVTGNGISPEASIIGPNLRDTYIAFTDATRGTAGDYFAMRMD